MTEILDTHLVGRCLVSLRYEVLDWEVQPDASAKIDAVAMAVIMDFEGCSVAFRWDLRPPTEQLVVVASESVGVGRRARRIDVSRRWSTFVGAELVAARWSYHETGEGLQPWAVTLSFAGVGDLVVALGELVAGSPSYLPDSLIITASEDLAREYQPRAALEPAWKRKDGA